MPLFEESLVPAPLIAIGGGSDVAAAGSLQAGLKAAVGCGTSISADLRAAIAPIGSIDCGTEFSALGRLNGEPNKFGSTTIECGSDLDDLGSTPRIRGKANFAQGTNFAAHGRVARADKTILKVFLTVIAAPNAGKGDTLSARIHADGVNYAIRSMEFAEGRADAGTSLNCTLQKPADRAAILAADSFKFEIYTRGQWNELFDTGVRTATGFSFAFAEGKPNDVLSVTTAGPIADKLNKSPLQNTTVFDNFREQLNAADFRPIYDSDGGIHSQQLIPIADMQLFDLLGWAFDQCGFDGFETDFQNYAIRRGDFATTGTILSGVASHIGQFSPLIFVRDNTIWLLDSTKKIPPGFPAPIALNSDQYRSAQFTEAELNADGFVVTYSADELNFDYTNDREVIDDADELGTFGGPDYQIINRKRTFRDYFKNSNPNVPVRTDKINETETTRAIVTGGGLLQINEAIETIMFDSLGLLQTITKQVEGLVPELSPGFPNATKSIRTERTVIDYEPDIQNPRRKFPAKVTKTIQGLVVTDTENEHLGQPFKQAFTDGHRAGNLAEGQTVTFETIETIVETTTQNLKGQSEVRTKTTNFLTSPPTIINATTDGRAGDSSLNARSATGQEVIVFRRDAVRTNARMRTLNVGEMPPQYAIPLARRILENRSTRTGTVELLGVNLGFARGLIFELFDRDGFTLGRYIIEGRRISASGLGTPGQSTRQTLEVLQV